MSYVLNGTNLPTPKFFKREYISISKDVKSISGKQSRDKRTKKEKFMLSWETLSSSELTTILNIVNLNTPVTFSVTDGNLFIGETNVIVRIKSVDYIVPGENYIAATELELEEVE